MLLSVTFINGNRTIAPNFFCFLVLLSITFINLKPTITCNFFYFFLSVMFMNVLLCICFLVLICVMFINGNRTIIPTFYITVLKRVINRNCFCFFALLSVTFFLLWFRISLNFLGFSMFLTIFLSFLRFLYSIFCLCCDCGSFILSTICDFLSSSPSCSLGSTLILKIELDKLIIKFITFILMRTEVCR